MVNTNHVAQLTLGLLSGTSVVHQDGGYENSGVFHTTPIWVK